jgi:ABC-type nitrate/sulfonate/bicarbonate transport system substrate-binding protein
MRVLIGVIIWVAAGLALARGATAAETITFGTDWKAEAEHGGYYQAIAAGIYRQHGLEVTLRQGGPDRSFTGRIASASPDAPEPEVRIHFPPAESQMRT